MRVIAKRFDYSHRNKTIIRKLKQNPPCKRHVYSPFVGSGYGSKLVKRCLYCPHEIGKKEFLKMKKESNAITAKAKLHIDLFW